MQRKTKLLFLVSIMLIHMLFFNVRFVSAYSFIPVIPEPISAANDIISTNLNRFNLSIDSVKNMAQTFNVAENKTNAPQVSIYFTPSDPKNGQKITAKASPMYFKNPKEKLYYTWYIKHDGCDNDGSKSKCDSDNDGDIDENDWKVEAMRIIATNGYDNTYEPVPNYDGSGDNDEYLAHFGGDDQISDDSYCYVHDFETGDNCEIVKKIELNAEQDCQHLFPHVSGSEVGDESFSGEEEKFWRTNPQNPNTAGNGNPDEANVAGLGQDTLTWTYQTGDQVGVAVEGVSMIPTKHDDSSYMIMWALPLNDFKCAEKEVEVNDCTVSCSTGFTPKCVKTEYSDTDYCSTNVGEPECIKDTNGNLTASCGGGGIFAKCVPNKQKDLQHLCATSVKYVDATEVGCPGIYTWAGGSLYWSDATGACVQQGAGLTNSDRISCENLFYSNATCQDGDHSDGIILQEAENEESSAEKAVCNEDNTYKSGPIKGYYVEIPAVETDEGFDLNGCLEENLVNPAEQKFEKIDVSLSSSPDDPINDPEGGGEGDILSVQSVITNGSEDPAKLEYEWKISTAKDMSELTSIPESGKDITKELVDQGMVKKLKGPNLQDLNIELKLNDKYFEKGISYLKVKVSVKEWTGNKVREGKSDVIVKINSGDNKIKAYLAKVDTSGNLYFTEEDAICVKKTGEKNNDNNNLSYYICPVLENGIVGLKAGNSGLNKFSWTIDGTSWYCDSSISNLCSGSDFQENIIFFPVAKKIGESINVKLKANYFSESGSEGSDKSVEINRNFQVVEPYVKIVSGDINSTWPKFLGRYSDVNGNEYNDYSSLIYHAQYGGNAKLKSEFHPDYLEKFVGKNGTGNLFLEWFLDDESKGNSEQLEFPVDKSMGEVYKVDLSALYQIPVEIRKALNSKWGVDISGIESESLEGGIEVEVSEAESGESAYLNSAGRVLASLVSNLPSQFAFLLKTALSIFVVVFVSGIASNLLPSFLENKNRNVKST